MIEYDYDPLGRRITKKVNGSITEKYLWQGSIMLLAVYNGDNSLRYRFEYADGRMPVAMTDGSGNKYYLSYDQVGSLRLVTDAAGNAVKRLDYDSFGYVVNDTNPSMTMPVGFAGGLYDGDTGIIRFGSRDYDPDTGRWTAKDPILFNGGDSDLYGYCVDDPVSCYDSDGLDTTTWLGDGRGITDGSKNGNWGGKNWSGGWNPSKHGGLPGPLPPMDSADECYKRHDFCYSKCDISSCSGNNCKKQCDKTLVNELQKLPDNPHKWPRPPRPGTEKDSSDFRKKAIWYFQ